MSIWGQHTYQSGRSKNSLCKVLGPENFSKAVFLEPVRQGSRPKCGSTRTKQGFLGARYGNFSGLKILEGNFPGARSAGLKARRATSQGALAHFQILNKLYLRMFLKRLRAVLTPRSLF